MEVVLLGALLIKYDTIVSTFWNLDPFLNIERNSGYVVYQIIILLKSLYVFYAMANAIPKLWMLIFTGFSKYYLMYMRPELAISIYFTATCHFLDACFTQMSITGMIAMGCESFEFLLDINVLFCTLYYAAQTYKREIHKLVTIICLSLSIGSYVNNIESAETFKFGVYYLLIVMCLATVFPLLPNRKKYGQRLIFYYMLLVVWIVYKGGLHSTNGSLSALQYGSKSDVCNIRQRIYESQTCSLNESQKCSLNETLENLSLDDILNYGNLRKVDLKVKSLTAVMKDEKKCRVNKKEASCKYDLIPDIICPLKVDSTEENSNTEIKGRTEGTTNPEIGRIEATVYDKVSMTDMKVDNTEQENSETEIKEKTDGTTNQEIELIEATENDKSSMTENYKLILTFGGEKNVLEDNTTLNRKVFTEDIQHWRDNAFEDEIFSANLFEMSETNGYAEYMGDQSDTTENFPATETSVDDIDYTIEKRLGNVERIGDEIRHEIAYKALEFKTSDKSGQQSHQNDEFVAMKQTFYNSESEETLTRTKAEIKETKFQATETYVLSDQDAIKEAIPAEALMDETTEAKASETRVLELAESEVSGESRFPSNHISKNEENYLPSENGNTTASECKVTDKRVDKSQNSLLKDTEIRNLEDQETELFSINIMEEIGAKGDEAILSKALANPNQVDEIQNKWAVSKETNENKVDSSDAAQVTNFGSIEYLRTKSKETCKSQMQEPVMETKTTKVREMTEAEYSQPIASITTKDCEKKFALASYPRASDYEICKPIPSTNNHEISKDSDSSGSKFEPFKTQKTKTINLQTPENADKTTRLKSTEDNIDSADRVVSSNAPDFYFPREVGDELRKSRVNTILNTETTEYESMVFVDSETTTLQTPISYQTSKRERRDPGENNLPLYSNEASAIKFKEVHNYETKKTESGKFKDTKTKETKEHGSGSTKISNPNAEEIKFTLSSSPQKNKLESAKKDEAESITTDTIKSQANEIDSMESNEGNGSTDEPVLPKSLPSNQEREASGIRSSASRETEASCSGTTKLQAPKVYSSHTIEPKSKQNEYYSDASESKDDSYVGTKELEPTETKYPKEREMEVIQVAGTKESQLKYTKSREIADAFTEASELKATKSYLPNTVQPKPFQDQETSDSIPNEHGYKDSHLRSPTLEETKASYSITREIKTIKVVGSEKSQLPTKSSETRQTKDTYTGGTELGATRSDVLLTKPSQQDADYFIEKELEFNEVCDPSEKEIEVSNASNFDARDINPIKLVGLEGNQPKISKTRHPGDSFTGTRKLQDTKKVPRTTETKQFKEREVSDFTASEHENEISHRRAEELEVSKSSYPSDGKIQSIEVMGLEKSSPKSTKARETKDAYKRDAELGDTKTDGSRTFERKPTKQGEVDCSFANETNKVKRHRKNVHEATTVSYFVATEIEPIKVTGPKASQLKPTKSGDVGIGNSESTIDSKNIQTQANKVEELEGNKFEMAESSKDNFIDVSEEIPILVERHESDYPNTASDSEEIRYEATKIDNFGTSEYIPITSGYIGSRKVNDASEFKVTEFKESEIDVGELGKQAIKINPISKTESEENTFQSNGPTVASIPHELKLRKITNHKANEFDLSEASNVRANENELIAGNGKLIQPNTEIKHLEVNEKNKAYKREIVDINRSEELQAEKKTEVIEDGMPKIREIRYQERETAKRAIEHTSRKSEISGSYKKTELLMPKSDATLVKGSYPKETEDAKFAQAETVIADVERSEKILSKGNVPHRSDSADIVATKIQGIKPLDATETIPEMADIYTTAATFQGDLAGETIATKSEVQISRMKFAEAAGQAAEAAKVFQSA